MIPIKIRKNGAPGANLKIHIEKGRSYAAWSGAAMIAIGIVSAYFVIRFIFQFDESVSVFSTTRKRIIGLGVMWLPIVTIPY